MNSTRLKFELIEPQSGDRTLSSPLTQLSSRLRREDTAAPRPQARPRLLQDLAQGLDYLMAQLGTAETDRDRAQEEVERWKGETARMRAEISDLQREVHTAATGAAELRTTRQTLENVVTEQQRALLLSMELMHRFEREIDELRGRVEAMETAPPLVASPSSETLEEIQQLRAKLEVVESDKAGLRDQAAKLEKKLETALQEDDELRESSKILEQKLEDLQNALDSQKADFVREITELQTSLAQANANAKSEAEKLEEFELSRHTEASATAEKLSAALEENARLREELAEQSKIGDPSAAIRALEQQRDSARAEAASARADVSIQSAEIETKDALISALERALEQQHGSLRSLEQRFADYATKLQELRLDRLKMPGNNGDPSKAVAGNTTRGTGVMRLVKGFMGVFSPSAKPPIEPSEESGQ